MQVDIKENYKKITSDKGFYLTYFKEGSDIITFTDFNTLFCALDADLSDLREIDEETHTILNNELKKVINNENGSI